MKIVVLDAHALNPGDLDWSELNALGECVIHNRTAPDAIIERAHDAECILTNKSPVCADTLFGLPKLRYIGVLATGYNVVDVAAAAARGIVVTNVPSYGTRAVAQHAFALLLELSNSVGLHAQSVREGAWASGADWTYWKRPLVELDGLTLGLVGYGRIGRAVAEIGRAFGMNVNVTTRRQDDAVPSIPLDTLFRTSDVVSLHCPLTPATHLLVNRERLNLMKNSAVLINTARGQLVDETALADALNHGVIAGAAIDVLLVEPPPPDNPLLAAANCIITPHIAWAAREARARLLKVAVENLRAWQQGAVQNAVSPGSPR